MRKPPEKLKQLNVAISQTAWRIAQDGAEDSGMLVRKWVERAILKYQESIKLQEPAR